MVSVLKAKGREELVAKCAGDDNAKQGRWDPLEKFNKTKKPTTEPVTNDS